jgi:YggT family protein
MPGPYIGNTLTFVIEFLAGILILIVLMRFLLQYFRADFYNPLSQFIVNVTTPLLRPMRRFIPGYAGFDLSALVLMLVLQFLEILLVHLITGQPTGFVGLAVMSIGKLLMLTSYVFMFAVLVLVILSWVQPQGHNPMVGFMRTLADPLMRPARRLIPPLGMMDVSALVVLLGIGIIQRLFIAPILGLGYGLL